MTHDDVVGAWMLFEVVIWSGMVPMHSGMSDAFQRLGRQTGMCEYNIYYSTSMIFSAVPISMVDERTMSMIIWLNSPVIIEGCQVAPLIAQSSNPTWAMHRSAS